MLGCRIPACSIVCTLIHTLRGTVPPATTTLLSTYGNHGFMSTCMCLNIRGPCVICVPLLDMIMSSLAAYMSMFRSILPRLPLRMTQGGSYDLTVQVEYPAPAQTFPLSASLHCHTPSQQLPHNSHSWDSNSISCGSWRSYSGLQMFPLCRVWQPQRRLVCLTWQEPAKGGTPLSASLSLVLSLIVNIFQAAEYRLSLLWKSCC